MFSGKQEMSWIGQEDKESWSDGCLTWRPAVSQFHGNVIQGYESTVPETFAEAHENHLQFRKTELWILLTKNGNLLQPGIYLAQQV